MKHLAGQRLGKGNKGSSAKMSVFRSKAEERYAEIQKRKRGIKQELDDATRLRLEKTARLRQLRLAKEAEDAAAKQAAHDIKAAGRGAFKKTPSKTS
jgi:regulator of replication initiation timing